MPAGPKTELITIERETRTSDGMGGFTSSWASLGEMWAECKVVRASETERQGAMRSLQVLLATAYAEEVRLLGVAETDRVSWDGRKWNVREIRLQPAHSADCEIVAETGVSP